MSENVNKNEKKRINFKHIITKEYPAEKYVILVLGIIFLLFASWLGMGRLAVAENIRWFGNSTQNVFVATFVALGFIAIVIAIWAQIVSSTKEMKKVTPPTSRVMAELTVKVFIFILILVLIFFLLDNGLSRLITWLKDIINS